MEEDDKLRDKINKYHSPFSVEEEWNSFLIKKDNIALQNKVRRKSFIIVLSALLLLFLFGPCSDKKYFEQKSDVLTTLQKEGTTLQNEQIIIESNRQTKSVGSRKKNNSKIEEIVNNKNTFSTNKNDSIEEQQKNETNIFSTKNNPLGFSTNSELNQQNKLTSGFGNELNQNNSKSNLDTISQLPENIFINTQEAPTKNITEGIIIELPVLRMELVNNDSSEASLLQIIDSLKIQPSIAFRKNYLFLELLGQGAFYSLNYGRMVGRQSFGRTDLQVGISYSSLDFDPPGGIEERARRVNTLLVPMSINQSIRLKGNHNLTFGLGWTFLVNRQIETGLKNFSFLGKYKLGYLYHQKNKRIFYKIEVISPFYSNDPYSERTFPCLKCNSTDELNRLKFTKPQIWGGIGVGWHF